MQESLNTQTRLTRQKQWDRMEPAWLSNVLMYECVCITIVHKGVSGRRGPHLSRLTFTSIRKSYSETSPLLSQFSEHMASYILLLMCPHDYFKHLTLPLCSQTQAKIGHCLWARRRLWIPEKLQTRHPAYLNMTTTYFNYLPLVKFTVFNTTENTVRISTFLMVARQPKCDVEALGSHSVIQKGDKWKENPEWLNERRHTVNHS